MLATRRVLWAPDMAGELIAMGGAPIGAGGHDPTFRGNGDRGTYFLDNSYLTYCSYHAYTLMSTPQTYELGWLSYLSNMLSPTGQKVGVKNLSTHFQNCGSAPAYSSPRPTNWKRGWSPGWERDRRDGKRKYGTRVGGKGRGGEETVIDYVATV